MRALFSGRPRKRVRNQKTVESQRIKGIAKREKLRAKKMANELQELQSALKREKTLRAKTKDAAEKN